MNEIEISVVIINHYRSDLLEQCLQSLSCQQGVTPKQIVVCHTGDDVDGIKVAGNFGADNCVLDADAGFALAANHGVSVAAKNNPDGLVLVLCNDIVITPYFLQAIHAPGTDGLDIRKLLQGPQLYEDGRYIGGAGDHSRLTLLPIKNWLTQRISRPVDIVGGACFIVPSWFVLSHGLFDTTFWAYAEDFELSIRARKLGLIPYFNAQLKGQHTRDNIFSRNLRLRYYYGVRNWILAVKRHRWGFYPINVGLFALLLLLVNIIRRNSFIPMWKGYIDALKNISGKQHCSGGIL